MDYLGQQTHQHGRIHGTTNMLLYREQINKNCIQREVINIMAYKYFLFSKDQMDFRKNMDSKVGKTYRPGYVIVGGRRKTITEINSTGRSSYTDVQLVAEGEENNFDYQKPSAI